MAESFDVGGVTLARPFKIRRLNHFGINVCDVDASVRFYRDLLGYRLSDRLTDPNLPDGAFLRYCPDHHCFVLLDKNKLAEIVTAMGGEMPPTDVNQITWQVGSLREVVDAKKWFDDTDVPVQRAGRDMPGSNWHAYITDPDGYTNELLYGIEQVGWSGRAKPQALWPTFAAWEPPALPHAPELDELAAAIDDGIDIDSGFRDTATPATRFDVDGVLLPQPFKVVAQGPVYLFVDDVDVSADYYRRVLGFTVTEEVSWNGHRCLYLRINTEHHSVGLFPTTLREELADESATCLSFGMQVANYRQLRDALTFFREQDVTVEVDRFPAALHPGIDYAFHVVDPSGQRLQLFYAMEQIGWDGRPRPTADRVMAGPEPWPTHVDDRPEIFAGQTYPGPWL